MYWERANTHKTCLVNFSLPLNLLSLSVVVSRKGKEIIGNRKKEKKKPRTKYGKIEVAQGFEPAKEIGEAGWLQVRFNAINHRCQTTVPISS